MIKVTLWILFLAFTSYALFCAFLYSKQRSLIYYPSSRTTSSQAESILLDNEGQSLQVWHVAAEDRNALIYFGGNAEDVALSIPELKHLFPGYAIYLPHYRGYGGSTGHATEQGLYSDALALYREIVNRYDSISVMGRSLGTGVAVYLASQKTVKSLILVTPYDSMTRLASGYYPFLPVSLLLKDRFESVLRAAEIDTPTLVLIAEHDEVIPRKNSNRLVAELDPSITEVVIVPGTGHNSIETSPVYEDSLKTFLFSR